MCTQGNKKVYILRMYLLVKRPPKLKKKCLKTICCVIFRASYISRDLYFILSKLSPLSEKYTSDTLYKQQILIFLPKLGLFTIRYIGPILSGFYIVIGNRRRIGNRKPTLHCRFKRSYWHYSPTSFRQKKPTSF